LQCADAGNNAEGNSEFFEGVGFLGKSPEDTRITALEADNALALARALTDELGGFVLLLAVCATTFSDVDGLGMGREFVEQGMVDK